MKDQSNHIIQKQRVEISFANMDSGMGMQDYIATVFTEKLKPKMEALFNDLADGMHRIKLDELVIDCGVLPTSHWEDELVNNAIDNLRKQLLQANKIKLQQEDIYYDFFYFLQHGILPWNSTVKTVERFESAVLFEPVFFEALEKVTGDQLMMQRLLNQFSDKFTTGFIKALLQYYKSSIKRLAAFNAMIKEPVIIRQQKEAVLRVFVHEINMKAGEEKLRMNNKPTEATDRKKSEKSKEIFVNNAGLVLLHPFLPTLFENIGLIKQQQWVNEEAQHAAVAITCFLVWGRTDVPEFDLPLSKLICGLSIDAVLNNITPVKPETQVACDDLLQQVIGMWRSLKNTGIVAFRESFLQREGKLSARNNGLLLQPAQNAIDVLLSSLPWGISVIKLPWMKEIIFTEWG